MHPDGFADNAGIRLAYYERGTGPKTVLLIMGINMRAAHWGEHFIDALAERFRVVAFDNRGTGFSTKPVDAITAELWASDALCVLDALAVERAAVIGVSMGGRIAQQLMVDHPERVERVVLVSSAVGGPEAVGPTPQAIATFAPPGDRDPELVRREGIVALAGPGFAERDPAAIERLVELGAVKRTPLSVLAKQIEVLASDVCERLTRVRIPTLVAHGDADPLVPYPNGELLERLIPHANLFTLRGCGHIATWEAPDALLAEVMPFLEPHAGRRGNVGAA